jgi:hypothetical protein
MGGSKKKSCKPQLPSMVITPAIKYLNIVIPANPGSPSGAGTGIQVGTGCLSKIPYSSGIKFGMTGLVYLVVRLIRSKALDSTGISQTFVVPYFLSNIGLRTILVCPWMSTTSP